MTNDNPKARHHGDTGYHDRAARLQRSLDAVARGDAAALADLTLQAAAGDVGAARTLGEIYLDGLAGTHDLSRACAWLRRAAEREDGAAARLLAVALMEDRSAGHDDDAVVAWLQRAVALGDTGAMAILGACRARMRDPGGQLDGLALLHRAAHAGDGFALKQLAWCYERGRAVNRNPELVYTLMLMERHCGHTVGRWDLIRAASRLTQPEVRAAEHRADAWWRDTRDADPGRGRAPSRGHRPRTGAAGPQ